MSKTSFTKHQYDLDIVATYHAVLKAQKKHCGSINIDLAQLRKVAELQVAALGFESKQMIRQNWPVVLRRSAGSGTFYWWLSLALAVEKPALIRLRLNHILKFESGREKEFLADMEFTVLAIMLQHDLPGADIAADKVENWINSKNKELGIVRKVPKRRKSREQENPFNNDHLPIISDELSKYVAGFDFPKSEKKDDYSADILQVLLGHVLKQKLLLDMNQADLGRKFLEYADLGYIRENGKLLAFRILQSNFKYRNDKGKYCSITNTLYKKYLAG